MSIVGKVQETITKASAGGVNLSQEALSAVRTVASFTLQEHITALYEIEADVIMAGARQIGKSRDLEFHFPRSGPKISLKFQHFT